jgi:hypothetical protein
VLGPWVNGRATNAFTGAVITVLITLSLILVSAVVFPHISAHQIFMIMAVCAGLAVVGALGLGVLRTRSSGAATPALDAATKENWRMPSLAMLAPVQMSLARRVAMLGMWAYLVVAMAAVVYHIVMLALGR